MILSADILLTDGETLLTNVVGLLEGTARLPADKEYATRRLHLDAALGEAWNSEWWPDLMAREQRYFRPNWSAASTYAAAAELFDPPSQIYYQSLQAGNLNNPPTIAGAENSAWWAQSRTTYAASTWVTGNIYAVGDKVFYIPTNRYYQCYTAHTASGTLTPDAVGGNARWGILTPFERFVSYQAAGKTPIGDVFQATDVDPWVNPRWKPLDGGSVGGRYYVRDEVAFCWLQFRGVRPRLIGNAYDATLAYAVGKQVYWDNAGAQLGNWYDCLVAANAGENPTTTPAKWSLTQIPLAFEGYLIWAATAKAFVGDAQTDRKTDALAMAEGFLLLELDRVYRQRGEAPTLAMRTY